MSRRALLQLVQQSRATRTALTHQRRWAPTTTTMTLGQRSLTNTLSAARLPNYRAAHSQVMVEGGAGFNRGGDEGDVYPNKPTPDQLPKVVIFDKNGTLIDFHSVWTPWIKSLTERLEAATGLQLKQRIFRELDFCIFTEKTRHGLLAHGTSWQIKHEVETVLFETGFSRRHAQLIIEQCWQDVEFDDPKILSTQKELKMLFQMLRAEGIKVAICSSDTRKSCETTLEHLQLMPLVDKLVCGDDIDADSKSSGRNIHTICESLGVKPSDAVVIGDTQIDMEMGQTAGAGLTVGVLSGVGTRLDLGPRSDIIINDVNDLLPMLFKDHVWQKRRDQIHQGPKVNRVAEDVDEEGKGVTPGKKASLVIFDKDGTLICFHSMWTPWVKSLVQRLEEETGLNLQNKVLTELGFNHETSKWQPGICAEGTVKQNQDVIIESLIAEGLANDEAESVVQKVWTDGDHKNYLKMLDNPHSLFETLKTFGVKIAICTADSRSGTELFLEAHGLAAYVDMLVCGDDDVSIPKPAPNNALTICKALNVDPTEAVVIGDTIADMGMGKSAQLGATVGVLSGVGRVCDLDDHADHIVPSIKHILPIVLPENHKDVIDTISES